MTRILISGSSGLIGRALLPSFEQSGAEVARLVRGPARNATEISWTPTGDLSPAAVSGFDVILHLAGQTVVGRWTAEKKRAIRESRVRGTQSVASALARTAARPRVFICASAVGFYGDRGDEILTEESPPGAGFPADLSRDWEAASRIAAEAGIRSVNLRFGQVLSAQGGALQKMLPVFRFGLGGRLGSGRQWWSWIHVDDIVHGIHHVIGAEPLEGAVNFVAPNPVRNAEFTRILAAVLGRPALLPLPAFAARLALGEMAQELMLSSQRVEPAKLRASGYSFHFPELGPALENLL